MTDEDLLLYLGDMGEADAEKAGVIKTFRPDPEAIRELAYASWRELAAPRFGELDVGSCHGHDNPDLWFSDEHAERIEAQAICLTCPVRGSCDTQSLAEGHGIWAGGARDGKGFEETCSEGHSEWSTNGKKKRCKVCERDRVRARRAKKKEAA